MLKVGSCRVDITPSKDVFLAGFKREGKSKGVHDKLYASAVSIMLNEDYLILVSLDLIGLFKDFLDPIRETFSKKLGIKTESIIFGSTHTHSGPDTLGLWGPDEYTTGMDEEYMKFLEDRIKEALEKATMNMKSARAKYSWTLVNPKGIVKNTRTPEIVDRYLSTLRFHDDSGNTIATVVNFACHPEALGKENMLISSDYVHFLRLRLEREIGGITVFLNGPLGGMLTPDVTNNSFEETERVGYELAKWILVSMSSEMEVKKNELSIKRKEFRLPLENVMFMIAKERGLLKRKTTNKSIVTEVSVAKIGDVTLATIPGEALPRVGMEIRGFLNGKSKILVCLGNDEIGYIIPEDEWNPKKYEESMSVGKNTAKIIQEEIRSLIICEDLQ